MQFTNINVFNDLIDHSLIFWGGTLHASQKMPVSLLLFEYVNRMGFRTPSFAALEF